MLGTIAAKLAVAGIVLTAAGLIIGAYTIYRVRKLFTSEAIITSVDGRKSVGVDDSVAKEMIEVGLLNKKCSICDAYHPLGHWEEVENYLTDKELV